MPSIFRYVIVSKVTLFYFAIYISSKYNFMLDFKSFERLFYCANTTKTSC